MGNKQTKSKPNPGKPVRPKLADSSDDEDVRNPDIEEQAEVFINLKIFLELPNGSTQQHKLTVNPRKKVIQIKKSLVDILDIPWEDIQIYRHRNPQTEMPNNIQLSELVVPDNEQLRVRDKRKVYSQPISG